MTSDPAPSGPTLAVGLVYRPEGTPSPDRSWGRALVVRQARAERLTLVDVAELDDDRARNGDVLRRLAQETARRGVAVLITDGLHPRVGRRLAAGLGLRHSPVPPPYERPPHW